MNCADTALLVIDMQHDFLDRSSPLFVTGGPAIVRTIAAVIPVARSAGMTVIHVQRSHRATGIDVDQSRHMLFTQTGGFLVAGTPGAEEPPELLAVSAPHDLIVVKTRWSAFFATDLDLLLRRSAVHNLVLTGVQTPNCIRATACDALSLDYATTVLSDATASQSDDIQQANIRDMTAMGITVMTAAAWKSSLGAPGRAELQ